MQRKLSLLSKNRQLHEEGCLLIPRGTLKSPALCSILIVNYNGGALLRDCVRCALASSFFSEVLIWDNASKDGSIDAIEADFADEARLTMVRHPENVGFAGGVNGLIPLSAGSWLLLLNPDCLLGRDTIAKVVEVMEKDAQAGMASCLLRNPDGSEQVGCRRRVPTPWRSLVYLFRLDRIFPNNPRFQNLSMAGNPLSAGPVEVEAISGAFMLVRRAASEMVGFLDPDYFLHCEDLDWCMRFRKEGWRILFVPEAVAVHAKGECSHRRPFFVEWHKHKGMARFYRKFFYHQYPAPLMWLVMTAVWCRFGLRCCRALLNRKTPGLRGDAA